MKHLVISAAALPFLIGCGGSSSPIFPAIPTTPVVVQNSAPAVVSPNQDQTAIVGIEFTYDATQSGTTFSDPDGDTLTYTIEYNPGPQGLVDTAGVISGTPSMAGTVEATIRVNDGNGREAIDVFNIVISAAASGQSAVQAKFSGQIDMDNLANYAAQPVPAYIVAPVTGGNPITNAGATLGRVLFYDTALSIDDTVSCSSCHVQGHGFSDPKLVSDGVSGGVTARHSMRLINTAFNEEQNFFWDERAASLEDQTTQPIQDENEHGFSGQNGRADLDALILKLEGLDYYQELFTYAFGDANITEPRLQRALGQFVKSIQSFDSKFDAGRAQAANDTQNFANFTADENAGKQLFMVEPGNGGAGCNTCHRAPEFDIRANTRHNGVVGVANSVTEFDLTNTKAPSLRDVVKPGGAPNGPFMHDGSLATLMDVINHYDEIVATTSNPSSTEFQNTIDDFLNFNGMLQDLNLTETQKTQMVAFLGTLTGSNVYTDEKLSDPF